MGAGGNYVGGHPSGRIGDINDDYTHRGYHPDPLFESTEKRTQVASFEKPLPDGARSHVKVFKGPKYYTIAEHRDSHDPGRSLGHAIGHLGDIVSPPDHYSYRVRRLD